jgi:hypothetical protein
VVQRWVSVADRDQVTCKRHVTVCLAASNPPFLHHPTHESTPRQKMLPGRSTQTKSRKELGTVIRAGRQEILAGKRRTGRGDSPAPPPHSRDSPAPPPVARFAGASSRALRRRLSLLRAPSAIGRGNQGRAPLQAGDERSRWPGTSAAAGQGRAPPGARDERHIFTGLLSSLVRLCSFLVQSRSDAGTNFIVYLYCKYTQSLIELE